MLSLGIIWDFNRSLDGREVLQHSLELEVVEDDGLPRVCDDAAHDGGEKVRVARVFHVAVVLVKPVLDEKGTIRI